MYVEVYCWYGSQYMVIPLDDIDEDMTTEDIIDAASEELFSDISWEVYRGEEN